MGFNSGFKGLRRMKRNGSSFHQDIHFYEALKVTREEHSLLVYPTQG